MISVKNLVKYYGSKKALDNVSFELEDGLIYGLLGPNGAGKSTTMNIMTGYIGATSGTVEINGFDILEEPEKAKRNIGYLPEIPPLYQDMTIEEYLLFVAELKKVKRDVRYGQVAEIIEKTGLEDVKGRLIKYLSKGYKQRVGLAGALVSYPDVLIFDGPTVGLDPLQINEMRDVIRSLKKDHTVILSSHIMQEVSAVCDKILIINDGKLVAFDTPEKLAERDEETVIYYKIKGERSVVLGVMNGVAEITGLNLKKDEGGVCELEITTKADAETLMNDLFFKMAEKKIAITESRVEKKSLEDIFLSFTSAGEGKENDSDL